ncbi:MAG TPA: hypothetical protein VNJ09_09760 [Chthonomonadales bacterium]|nr:hypothetical protein [Chthonomonadales bacterium]
MSESSRKTGLVLGAVVTAAGIVLASYLYMWRLRAERSEAPKPRSVSEVLSDCYARIRQMQADLSALGTPQT